jgi:predicted transcriptional regulator
MVSRDAEEIIADILNSTLQGIHFTRMMYGAYLPHNRAVKYLELLQKNDLIKYDEKTQIYKTTEKGKRYLEGYADMKKLLFLEKDNKQKELNKTERED